MATSTEIIEMRSDIAKDKVIDAVRALLAMRDGLGTLPRDLDTKCALQALAIRLQHFDAAGAIPLGSE